MTARRDHAFASAARCHAPANDARNLGLFRGVGWIGGVWLTSLVAALDGSDEYADAQTDNE
jgi:hypothetical protein